MTQNTTAAVWELAMTLKKFLREYSPEGRKEIWTLLEGGYCHHCGGDLPCACWNDE